MEDELPTIGDVINGEIHTISPSATVKDAFDVILDDNIRALPVVDDSGELRGIISERDILAYRTENILPKHAEYYVSVDNLMTREVRTVRMDESVEAACKRFLEYGHHVMPVVDDGEVVGLLGHRELLSFFAENLDTMEFQTESN